jgi:hypothetical protein
MRPLRGTYHGTASQGRIAEGVTPIAFPPELAIAKGVTELATKVSGWDAYL